MIDKSIVPLTWTGSDAEAGINISVKARSLKSLCDYPGDCLFRTHNYEFFIELPDFTTNINTRNNDFYAKIVLLVENIGTSGERGWKECLSSDNLPVISFSFMDDRKFGRLNMVLYWDGPGNFSFRGLHDFSFKIQIFSFGENQIKRVFNMYSSVFKVVSKPLVYNRLHKRKGTKPSKDVSNNTKKIKVEAVGFETNMQCNNQSIDFLFGIDDLDSNTQHEDEFIFDMGSALDGLHELF